MPEGAFYYGFSVEVKIAGDASKCRVEQWVHGSMTYGFSTLDPATDLKYRSGPWGLDMSLPPGNSAKQITEGSISYYDAPYIPDTFLQSFWGKDMKIDLQFLVLAYSTDKCGPPAVLKFAIQHEWTRDAAGAGADPGYQGIGAMGRMMQQGRK